jgi:PAS domain S-box-containing protein
VPGALPFAVASLLSALWTVGSIIEYLAVDRALKITGVKFQAIWQLPALTAITCFLLEYTWPGRWLTRRNLVLLSVVPVLNMLIILTNDIHHLAWVDFEFNGGVIPQYRAGYWLFLIYINLLIIVNLAVCGWLFVRAPQQRWAVAVIASAQVAIAVVFLLEAANVLHSTLSIEILALATLFLMFVNVLFGFYILDPVPLAHRVALEHIQMGMLVLDYRRRIVSLNLLAEHLLGVPRHRAIGRPICEILPDYPDQAPAAEAGTEVEFSRHTERGTRDYTLTSSLLKDWRGLDSGCLLLLRDITEQKLAQAQLIGQQQVLATLQERERLARDLHDTLGQVLGYASMQVEAAAKLARDGEVSTATIQLDRLGSVIRESHADVREHILNLRTAPSMQRPFFTAVQQYLESFTSNYDIQTHLSIGSSWNGKLFSPEAQLHIFRIMQEALSNARKHGKARHIQVKFDAEGERVCVIIQDDGLGFLPDRLETVYGQHFGLQFMQERAGQLGGTLKVYSRPGTGTQIVLEVPGKER